MKRLLKKIAGMTAEQIIEDAIKNDSLDTIIDIATKMKNKFDGMNEFL